MPAVSIRKTKGVGGTLFCSKTLSATLFLTYFFLLGSMTDCSIIDNYSLAIKLIRMRETRILSAEDHAARLNDYNNLLLTYKTKSLKLECAFMSP